MIELHELDRAECLRLLVTQDVGRVLFVENGIPVAHPVNYRLDEHEVVFATASRTKTYAGETRQPLGFQVDHIDPSTHGGWSVHGAGEAYEITAPMRLSSLRRTLGESWAPDAAGHLIAIPLRILHGRRLAPPGFVSDHLCGLPL